MDVMDNLSRVALAGLLLFVFLAAGFVLNGVARVGGVAYAIHPGIPLDETSHPGIHEVGGQVRSGMFAE